MLPAGRIEQLLEEILTSHRTPEEVCADAVDLLPEVRRHLSRLSDMEAELQALFPRSADVPTEAGGTGWLEPIENAGPLVRIPGYDVTDVLGRGGMGVVYKGKHLKLGRVVAIKMLLSARHATPKEVASIAREAQAIAALGHPNIVHVYDVGEIDGCPYFTMEYVEGGTLSQKLGGAPLPAADAARMIVTLGSAVEVAHRNGIVHRDLKPANVLLTSDGTPKVGDFGLAVRFSEDESLNTCGVRVGTPSYMAPEQASRDYGAVGPSADIYALGAILYELLTGRPPFRGESAVETQRQLLSEDPVPPIRLNNRVPRDLETICLKCLKKEQRLRYYSATALVEDMRRFQRNEPIRARPTPLLTRAAKWARRHPTAVTALAASLAFVVSLCAAGSWLLASRAANCRAVDQDLRDAVHLQKVRDFNAANIALDRAAMRLGNHGPTDLRQRLEGARRDSVLAARLEQIRSGEAGVVTFEKAMSDYAAAFSDAGLAKPGESPDVVARRIRESNIHDTLVIALDEWAFFTADSKSHQWLLGIVTRTSPDPSGWRDRAFDSATYRDPQALKAFLDAAPIDRQSLPLLILVGRKVMDWDPKSTEGIRFLTKVQEAYPDDFWANEILADALFDAKRYSEATIYDQAALALRPNTWWLHYNLGNALRLSGKNEQAEGHYRRTIELNLTFFGSHAALGSLLLFEKQYAPAAKELDEAGRLNPKVASIRLLAGDAHRALGRLNDAANAYRSAIAVDPQDDGAHRALRAVLMAQGRTDDVLADWRKAMQDNPRKHDAWDGYTEYCLYLGNRDEYERARSRLLAQFGNSSDPPVCERTARAALLLPTTSNDQLARATALIDRALTAGQRAAEFRASFPNYTFAKGLAEYRAGHMEAVISILTGDASKVLKPAPQLVMAMARFRLGQQQEARDQLSEAIRSFDWGSARAESSDAREVWICHILRREAESTITLEP